MYDSSGTYKVAIQGDGNLVVYRNRDSYVVWSSSLQLQSTDVSVQLKDLTWIESSCGMYYCSFVPSGLSYNLISSVAIIDFSNLTPTDILIPLAQHSGKIGLMSPVNTFHQNAAVILTLLYV